MDAALACCGYQLTLGHFIADLWVGGGLCNGRPADTFYEHGVARTICTYANIYISTNCSENLSYNTATTG